MKATTEEIAKIEEMSQWLRDQAISRVAEYRNRPVRDIEFLIREKDNDTLRDCLIATVTIIELVAQTTIDKIRP